MSSVAMSANAVQNAAKCCCMHMTANAMMLYNLWKVSHHRLASVPVPHTCLSFALWRHSRRDSLQLKSSRGYLLHQKEQHFSCCANATKWPAHVWSSSGVIFYHHLNGLLANPGVVGVDPAGYLHMYVYCLLARDIANSNGQGQQAVDKLDKWKSCHDIFFSRNALIVHYG